MSTIAISGKAANPMRPAPSVSVFAPPSFLLPAETRPHVAALFTFMRDTAALARDRTLPDNERLARLAAYDSVLVGSALGEPLTEPAMALRESLAATGIAAHHARQILQAREKEVRTTRMRRWSELLAYCRFAAAPAGRHVLALHGEDAALAPAAEALGTAARLLDVVRDCRADFVERGRIYLPADWMREAGCGDAEFARDRASPELRAVLDRVIERADRLIDEARPGMAQIRDARLRRWAATALATCATLACAARREDPLAGPIGLSRIQRLLCLARSFRRSARRGGKVA